MNQKSHSSTSCPTRPHTNDSLEMVLKSQSICDMSNLIPKTMILMNHFSEPKKQSENCSKIPEPMVLMSLFCSEAYITQVSQNLL